MPGGEADAEHEELRREPEVRGDEDGGAARPADDGLRETVLPAVQHGVRTAQWRGVPSRRRAAVDSLEVEVEREHRRQEDEAEEREPRPDPEAEAGEHGGV